MVPKTIDTPSCFMANKMASLCGLNAWPKWYGEKTYVIIKMYYYILLKFQLVQYVFNFDGYSFTIHNYIQNNVRYVYIIRKI